jgi:DNA-binding transcriptional LysR family regulator
MDWDHLRYFVAVAETGSLAGAARDLGVNHSTVFRRIRAFETDLGVRLFDRLPDGYALTTAGVEVLGHGARISESVAAISRTIAGQDYELTGDIRITTAANLATEYIAPALAGFQIAHPGIRVEVAVSDSDYDLARREADLALRATASPPDDLIGRRVAKLPWFVYGSPGYLEQHGRPESVDDLAMHALVGGDQSFRRLPVFEWLFRQFSREHFASTANDLNTMAALVASGLGLGFLPADQHRSDIERLFRLSIDFTSDLWILSHPDLRNVARIKAFSDYLFATLRTDTRLAEFALQ